MQFEKKVTSNLREFPLDTQEWQTEMAPDEGPQPDSNDQNFLLLPQEGLVLGMGPWQSRTAQIEVMSPLPWTPQLSTLCSYSSFSSKLFAERHRAPWRPTSSCDQRYQICSLRFYPPIQVLDRQRTRNRARPFHHTKKERNDGGTILIIRSRLMITERIVLHVINTRTSRSGLLVGRFGVGFQLRSTTAGAFADSPF